MKKFVLAFLGLPGARKFILGVVGLTSVGLGVGELFGWPWAAIVVGGVVYLDVILSEFKP